MSQLIYFEHVDLKDYCTMHLGGTADYLTTITTRAELLEAVNFAAQQNIPFRVIGGGSNVIWRDGTYQGLVIRNAIKQFDILDEDQLNSYVTVGSGENWDSVVYRCVVAGLSGLETLSLIPGTAGATPIQNVGAYGHEVSETIATLEAYDTVSKKFIILPNSDCNFGYRSSRFNASDKGRFIICSVTFHLLRSLPQPPFYSALAEYLDEHGITSYTADILRQAVITIRSNKLPNVETTRTAGSFFSNPIITRSHLQMIQQQTSRSLPHYEVDDKHVKIPAAWLIEQAGYKDLHDAETGIGTWPTQPLVLVNEHAKTTTQLLAFAATLQQTIADMFGVELTLEPELLP